MSTAAVVYDMGGSAEQNAALAMIMFAVMASPRGGASRVDRLHAAGIVADLLAAAEAGGFSARDEFFRLAVGETLTPRLEELGFDAVRCAGGAMRFFELLDLSTTPAEQIGGPH